MKNSLKKEEAKRAKLVKQMTGYVTKINKVLSDFAPITSRKKSTLTQEQQVLNVISKSGKKGITSDEVIRALPNVPYGSVTSKYSSLKNKGSIKVDGRTRNGASGKQQQIMWTESNYTVAA